MKYSTTSFMIMQSQFKYTCSSIINQPSCPPLGSCICPMVGGISVASPDKETAHWAKAWWEHQQCSQLIWYAQIESCYKQLLLWPCGSVDLPLSTHERDHQGQTTDRGESPQLWHAAGHANYIGHGEHKRLNDRYTQAEQQRFPRTTTSSIVRS